MKTLRILLLLSLVASSACQSAEDEKVYVGSVGNQRILLPTPKGFVSVETIPKLYAGSEAVTPPSHRFINAFYEKDRVEAWLNGKPLDIDRYFIIQTERQEEEKTMTVSEFSRLKLALNKAIIEKTKKEQPPSSMDLKDQRDVKNNISQLQKRYKLQPFDFRLGNTIILGKTEEQENYLSTASVTKNIFKFGNKSEEVLMASVSTILLAKGKLINIYGYCKYSREEDLTWLQDMSKTIASKTSSVNQ